MTLTISEYRIWISKQMLPLILVMKQRNILSYKNGKMWSSQRVCNALRTSQARPIVEQAKVYE